jgi:hypothetical protein
MTEVIFEVHEVGGGHLGQRARPRHPRRGTTLSGRPGATSRRPSHRGFLVVFSEESVRFWFRQFIGERS